MTEKRERRRTSSTIALLVSAAAAVPLSGCTLEQIQIGQLYVIDTPAAGSCPALVWRFAVNPQRGITGSLSRADQLQIASLSGQLNADDSFQMTASDVAEHRTASVTGQFTAQYSTISIHGDVAGSACDGQTFKLRLGSYFARQGGGGGGGGG